jgi:hypothetical protein
MKDLPAEARPAILEEMNTFDDEQLEVGETRTIDVDGVETHISRVSASRWTIIEEPGSSLAGWIKRSWDADAVSWEAHSVRVATPFESQSFTEGVRFIVAAGR